MFMVICLYMVALMMNVLLQVVVVWALEMQVLVSTMPQRNGLLTPLTATGSSAVDAISHLSLSLHQPAFLDWCASVDNLSSYVLVQCDWNKVRDMSGISLNSVLVNMSMHLDLGFRSLVYCTAGFSSSRFCWLGFSLQYQYKLAFHLCLPQKLMRQ